jgi:hypothetical protein
MWALFLLESFKIGLTQSIVNLYKDIFDGREQND